jgi:DNA polymerase (family 10)
MDQDRETMTARIIRAMHSPHLDVVAHLTARLMSRRAPIDVDVRAVFQAAVETGTVIEINASAPRLDLKDTHVREAREMGVVFAVNTDAHWPVDFSTMRLGVLQARRGWCERWRVINALPFEEFRTFMSLPKPERYPWLSGRA